MICATPVAGSRPDRRKPMLWDIERKLAADDARPIIFYRDGGPVGSPMSRGSH
jgi:hypothetical protein